MKNILRPACLLIIVIALLSFKPAPVFARQAASPELTTANKLFSHGNYSGALDAYRGAIRNQKPADQPPTQYWIGFCCLMQGKDAEAVKEFLKIPENYPAEGMWISTAYYWAARASERMGKKEQAAEFYRKAGGSGKSTQERFAMKKAENVKKGSGVQGTGARSEK
jgi:tetratricopeptide (TPR) repeat protein